MPDNPLSGVTDETISNVSQWWDNPATREWLIDKPIEITVTLVVAFIGHWLLRKVITKAANRSIGNTVDKSPKKASLIRPPFAKTKPKTEDIPLDVQLMRRSQEQRRQARIRTLSSVGKSAVAIFIWTWAALSILQTVGVNVGPLIASAGVVGVALGFGAQSLVKDFLSGIFMLIEDQYGVGDTIDVGDGIIGDVEDISLRVTTLRDLDGTVWYIRNGEILRVGNYSDEYSIARFQIPVGLSNDADHAWQVIEESIEAAVKDPEVKDSILEPPEMKGISDFEPDHMSFRVVVKTLPGHQWAVQRFVYARVLRDMASDGVSTPYPHGYGGINPAMMKNLRGSAEGDTE